MRRSPLRLSVAALALAALLPVQARGDSDAGTGDSNSTVRYGWSLIRHALHLDAQDQVVSHSISLSTSEATLELELSNGRIRTISLRSGHVLVDGRQVGDFAKGGALDRGWRRLLESGAALTTRDLLTSLQSWRVPTLAGTDQAAKSQLDVALRGLDAVATRAPSSAAALSQRVSIPAPSADTSVVAAAAPAVPDEAPTAPAAEVEAAPTAAAQPSTLDAVFNDVRNIVAVFIACAMLGFGAVFFGRRHLEIVADTATHSFGRSFVVGLLGQLLLLPTFAMLMVGLVLTLVGILLVPFAAVAYLAAALVALAGGYLAVAHAVGETFTRRRMAHGAFVRAPNAYGYLFTGLVGLLGLWAAAALTGWMGPVVLVFKIAAMMVTWLAMTTGFGAVLLSRAGLRETFTGRRTGEMSGEYLWTTPPATPTAARMNMDQK
ncbi:MAG: hypothetical protein ACHQU1_00575 [Gemmatimonadales bacterium]